MPTTNGGTPRRATFGDPDANDGVLRFSAMLRLAIERRGRTLRDLSHELAAMGIDVRVPTLSKWQNGRSRPTGAVSEQAVLALEDILGLAPGSLVRVMPPPNPTGPRPVTAAAAFPEFGGASDGWATFADVGVAYHVWHETVTIDAAGHIVDIAERSTVRATKDRVDSIVSAYHAESGHMATDMSAEALHGCSVSRVHDDLDRNVRYWELRLDAVLHRGQGTTFGWRYGPASMHVDAHHHIVVVGEDIKVLAIELAYPPDLPLRVFQVRQRTTNEPLIRVEGISLTPSGRSLVVLRDPPTGGHGLAWERRDDSAGKVNAL